MKNILTKYAIDILWISDPLSIYYLTGLDVSHGTLCISKERTQIFLDGRYLTYAKKNSPIEFAEFNKKNIQSFLTDKKNRIGFDSSTTTYAAFEHQWQFLPPKSYTLIPIFHPLREKRNIKSEEEISKMKKAAAIAAKGFLHVHENLKEGMTEEDVAWMFESFIRENGAQKLAFDTIVAFQENSALPHHHSGQRKLKQNDLILMDMGVVKEHYFSDMTRTFFFGKSNPEQQKIVEAVQKAHDAALGVCRPGALIGDLDKAARNVLREYGFEKYFLHSLGHGVGLEIHEFPRIKFDGEDSDVQLKPQMVFTIEPGVYIEGIGGARHENTICITSDGYENFYSNLKL